jgi:pyruvate ferredoxin oxidoreductase gamma subunit
MFRIRFHGRGGQGIKSAGRILGSAFFAAGYEVQDAPRYGAERRGAPIFAYVRAARAVINERGVIRRPDLVVVADDSLVAVPAAGVLSGVTRRTLMLLNSAEEAALWRRRLNLEGEILILPAAEGVDREALAYAGAACAGAAARLTGVISRDNLEEALRQELAGLAASVVAQNLANALAAYDALAPHAGRVVPGEALSAAEYAPPDWIELPFEAARLAAPAIHAAATSVMVKTGLWRTQRPVIDYDHCKGCMICVAVCPPHAIATVPERRAAAAEAGGGADAGPGEARP